MNKLCIFFTLLGISACIEPLLLVERTHIARRRSSGTRKLNIGYNRDIPIVMENVIHSPLENKRIYTKDNFYINAIHPKEKQAILYESILIDGKGSINDIDSFFVTPPPLRTTLAPKRLGDNDLPEFEDPVQVSQGSIKDEEEETMPISRHGKDLRLVTLPPMVRSTVAPFKHNAPLRRQFEQRLPKSPAPHQTIRFPAQPWQIPPINTPTTQNPLAQLFQPLTNPSLAVPKNPFFPSQSTPFPQLINQNQNLPNRNNSSYDPFIPIPVGNPPILLQQTASPVMENHRQEVHRIGFSRPPSQPIPLPSNIDNLYNEAKEKEFSNFQPNQIVKKQSLPVDFSIDSDSQVQKGTSRPIPRSIPDRPSSELLRNFVKEHPHVMTNLQKPMIYRGKEMVIPKMFNFSSPIQPVTVAQQTSPVARNYIPLINPNQKLDLCCRKQRVGPICQGLCNFDTFNDKTLVTAFLTNQCPGPQLGFAYDCASSKADHSQCCERAGLISFQAGKCMPFCRTHVATPSNVLDYFVCLQVFESIKGCYREYQLNNPNIFGD